MTRLLLIAALILTTAGCRSGGGGDGFRFDEDGRPDFGRSGTKAAIRTVVALRFPNYDNPGLVSGCVIDNASDAELDQIEFNAANNGGIANIGIVSRIIRRGSTQDCIDRNRA